jgi:hypothetical protein
MPQSQGNRPGGKFQNAENVRDFCLIPDINRPDGVIYPPITEALQVEIFFLKSSAVLTILHYNQ